MWVYLVFTTFKMVFFFFCIFVFNIIMRLHLRNEKNRKYTNIQFLVCQSTRTQIRKKLINYSTVRNQFSWNRLAEKSTRFFSVAFHALEKKWNKVYLMQVIDINMRWLKNGFNCFKENLLSNLCVAENKQSYVDWKRMSKYLLSRQSNQASKMFLFFGCLFSQKTKRITPTNRNSKHNKNEEENMK